MKKISVCMGIYNGENYIEEQLLSILQQSRQPDEVILCDDNSTDGTIELVQRFIEENKLQEKWHLSRNEENKGYPGNFYYAMSLCTGEIVFLADQDDIWHKEKIEKMTQVMELHPEAKAICCKFGLIDGEGKDIHTVMSPAKTKGTGQLRTISIADVFYKCEWPGMVMAYRNEWYRTCVAMQPGSRIPHDFLISALAAEEDGFLQMDEELAYHRRHQNNAGGEEHRLARLLNKKRKMKEVSDYLGHLENFEQERVLRTEKGRKALDEKHRSMRERYEALQSGKISMVVANAWKNRRNVRLATVVCDVMIVKLNEDFLNQ